MRLSKFWNGTCVVMPNVQCCHAQYYTRSSNYNNQWHKLIYDCWPLACFTDVDSWAQIWQVGFNLCCNSQSNIHYGYVPCDGNTCHIWCMRFSVWDLNYNQQCIYWRGHICYFVMHDALLFWKENNLYWIVWLQN